ncbi:MAG: O-antigen ligase family protein [Propionibacteriaceae bacterium]|nr:O-antigen ligase family protein [Propionibacteriaceae bacterium]
MNVRSGGWAARLARVVSWAIVPAVLGLGVVNSKRIVGPGEWPVTLFLAAGLPAAILLTVVTWWSGARPSPTARRVWVLSSASFAALLAWALASSFFHEVYYSLPSEKVFDVPVAPLFRWLPLVSAAIAICCALCCAAATPARTRGIPAQVTAVAVAILAVGAIGQYRSLDDEIPGNRLYSGLGGAAVMSVPLLIATAILLAGLRTTERRRWLWGTGVAVGVVMIVQTGSRAGLVTLAAYAALVVFDLLRSGRNRRRTVLVAVGVAAVTAVTLVSRPELHRLLLFSDPWRERNFFSAMSALTSSWWAPLIGQGHGSLWPWFFTESGQVPVSYDDMAVSPWGPLLPAPHSVYLWALVELGIVGLGLLLLVVGALLWSWWKAAPDSPRRILLAALVASLFSFATDTFLVSNFPASMLWWYLLFVGTSSVSGTAHRPPSPALPEAPAPS